MYLFRFLHIEQAISSQSGSSGAETFYLAHRESLSSSKSDEDMLSTADGKHKVTDAKDSLIASIEICSVLARYLSRASLIPLYREIVS